MSEGAASDSAVVEVAFFTEDTDSVKAFYALLLDAAPEAEWPGGAIFAAGGAKVLVHERAARTESGPPNEDHVALGVADLDARCDELRDKGVAFLVEPRNYPWGRSAYFRDPDGRLVELAETGAASDL